MAPGLVFGHNVAGDKHEFDPEVWTSNGTSNQNHMYAIRSSNNLPVRQPETGINVLIVGAGMGGLMAALECWRKGHNIVGILERNDGPVYSGSLQYEFMCLRLTDICR